MKPATDARPCSSDRRTSAALLPASDSGTWRSSVSVTRTRDLLAGVYVIADIVTDPPEAPLDVGTQSLMQMELGVTFNTEPRPRIGKWRWPRLGFGYRMAGDFSGWRIVFGAPF